MIAFAGCAKTVPEATATESTEPTAEPSSDAAMPADQAAAPAEAPKEE